MITGPISVTDLDTAVDPDKDSRIEFGKELSDDPGWPIDIIVLPGLEVGTAVEVEEDVSDDGHLSAVLAWKRKYKNMSVMKYVSG
jgi:hypothetical protein